MRVFILLSILWAAGISCSSESTFTPLEEGYVESSDGAQIYYQVMGRGNDSLVVIHGGPGAGMHSFMPSVKELAKDHTLIFYDQRGGGRSTLPEDTSHLKPLYFTDDLEALRMHFNLEKMKVITHSFGALLLAEYARTHPRHIERAMLHGSTGPVRTEMGAYYRQIAEENKQVKTDSALSRQAAELLSSLLEGRSDRPAADCREYERISRELLRLQGKDPAYRGTSCQASDEAVQYYYQYTAQAAPAYFGKWDYRGTLDNLKAPVLVIYGAEDSLALSSQQSWLEVYPNSRLLLVPGAEKAALSEQPDYTLSAIRSFFKGEWPEGVLRP